MTERGRFIQAIPDSDRGPAVFSGLDLAKKTYAPQEVKGYRVYKTASEFILVDAEAAKEAIEKSGIKRPYRVVRAEHDLGMVVKKKFLIEDVPNAPLGAESAENLGAKPEEPVAAPQDSAITTQN